MKYIVIKILVPHKLHKINYVWKQLYYPILNFSYTSQSFHEYPQENIRIAKPHMYFVNLFLHCNILVVIWYKYCSSSSPVVSPGQPTFLVYGQGRTCTKHRGKSCLTIHYGSSPHEVTQLFNNSSKWLL